MRAETQAPSSRRSTAEATVAPVAEAAIVEAPIAEAPVAEAPVVEPAIMEEMPAEALTATPSLPAPMETGGAGDGPLWEEVEEELFQHSRLAKHPRSLSRRWEPTSRLPFPLQDHVGRFTSITQLYEHASAQPAASHNAVGRAIRHLHAELLPHQATSLGNQVACMIAEYHLTASARQSSLCPILLPEVAPHPRRCLFNSHGRSRLPCPVMVLKLRATIYNKLQVMKGSLEEGSLRSPHQVSARWMPPRSVGRLLFFHNTVTEAPVRSASSSTWCGRGSAS